MNASKEIPSDILSRLQKLLRLADTSRGATPAEAAAAMAKAQEIMREWQIEQHTVNLEQSGNKTGFSIGEDRFVCPRNQRYDYDNNVAHILQACFAVKIIWTRTFVQGSSHPSGLHHTYIIIGDLADRQLAMMALPILLDAMRKGVGAYLKARQEKWTARVGRAYYDGLTEGYIYGSEQGIAKAMASAKKANADAYAIVLVDKKDAIVRYLTEEFTDLKKSKCRPSSGNDHHARQAGYQAGQRLDLSTTNKLQ